MTNYPFSFDNNITLPGVSGSTQEDIAITALRNAVFAIEIELGITPSGIYPDVRTRLDILESRIGFGVPPNIPNDGYVKSPLFIWNVPENIILSISDGYGAPTENRLDGSLYMRSDGYANNQLYVRLNGSWFPVQTEQFQASNDLEGFPLGTDGHLAQTVIGLYNHPLSISLNTIGSTQDGYHLTWDNTDGYWRAETGFLANNDLAPAVGSGTRSTGRTAQTVVGLQNHSLSSGLNSPNDGYALIWEATANHWDQQPLAVVWHSSVTAGDGYVTRTNIRSNKILQSTSLIDGYVGMINFGTSTNASGGASNNYAMILGGDRNSASGVHSIVVGGFSNSATDGYSVVLTGNGNTASLANATVINGVTNTANASQATVINGTLNSVTGANSSIGNGTNNSTAGTFTSILNGSMNTITANSTHAFIGFGTSNMITGGASSTFSMILGGSSNQTNAANVLIGPGSGANTQSNNSVILNGTTNTIGLSSLSATILNGAGNNIANSSQWGFIGSGQSGSATGNYATILNGASITVNGLSSTVLNGLTNSATGSYLLMGTGNNNTISGGVSYSAILDGYQNLVTSSGGLILDGYSNTINGQFSSILNGNGNTVNGFGSTVLNGSANTIDVNSSFITLQSGINNQVTGSTRLVLTGNGNVVTNCATGFVMGQFNTVQSNNVKVLGDSNTVGPSSNYVRVFGTGNNVTASVINTAIFGNANQVLNSSHDNIILGNSHTVDGGGSLFGSNTVVGLNNQAVANNTFVEGQFGKSRVYGQHVHSVNTGFGTGRTGEAQFSRVVLDGYSTAGSQFFLQTHDPAGSPANLAFVDGYSYEMSIRILIVNVQSVPASTTPARFIFDVLAHQESGTLSLDEVNTTLTTQTTTNWTVTLGTSGNQLTILVNSDGGSDTRRAVATVEWRELSRIP
jgi:hypothetical protein